MQQCVSQTIGLTSRMVLTDEAKKGFILGHLLTSQNLLFPDMDSGKAARGMTQATLEMCATFDVEITPKELQEICDFDKEIAAFCKRIVKDGT